MLIVGGLSAGIIASYAIVQWWTGHKPSFTKLFLVFCVGALLFLWAWSERSSYVNVLLFYLVKAVFSLHILLMATQRYLVARRAVSFSVGTRTVLALASYGVGILFGCVAYWNPHPVVIPVIEASAFSATVTSLIMSVMLLWWTPLSSNGSSDQKKSYRGVE